MLIGILGNKGAGKDTIADFLVSNEGFQKKSFADPLKKACRELFLLSDEQLYGNEKEISDPKWFGCTPRQIMQYVGTDLLRDQLEVIMPGINKTIFIHHFMIWYQKHMKVVVADVRFQNEVDAIKQLGGIIIKVIRHENQDNHVSETEINKITNFDHVVYNDGTIDDLHQKIQFICYK